MGLNLSGKGITMIYEQKGRTILHWDRQQKHIDAKFTLTQFAKWKYTISNLHEFSFPENHLQHSDNWMDQFEKRTSFRAYRSHGESGSVDINNSDIQERIKEIK